MATLNLDVLTRSLAGIFLKRNDVANRLGNISGSFQNIPGLVGFWPMSSVQRSTGNAYDLSGQGRTLTYNGNPTYNIGGLMPYIDLDGTGDYLSRADETDLDILGTETIYASAVRGLTIGGWFWVDTAPGAGVFDGLIGKWIAGQESYLITASGAASPITFSMIVRNAGLASNISASTTGALSGWHFLIGHYVPSTSVTIYIGNANGLASVSSSTNVPASLPNTTSLFNIGAQSGGTNPVDGRASLCFLSANALPDAKIFELFENSRVLFGV